MRTSLTHRVARVATALSALLIGAAGVTVGLMAYVPAPAPLRTIEIGIASDPSTPADHTARVIRDSFASASDAERAKVCAATPAQLRAASPHASFDPSWYRVETAIITLADLCN